MAARLSEEGIPAALRRGFWGELSAWVDGRKVARRTWLSSLSDEAYVAAVRAAVAGSGAGAGAGGAPSAG